MGRGVGMKENQQDEKRAIALGLNYRRSLSKLIVVGVNKQKVTIGSVAEAKT